jgi:predicted nucleic acid-binding protein
VLTETTHLVGRASGGRAASVDFFLRGGAVLIPSTRESLARARVLVGRYADVPMDFADATLVALAEDLETPLVLTTDRRGFAIYRWKDTQPFTVLPERSAPKPPSRKR